jgi:hypothetical protein
VLVVVRSRFEIFLDDAPYGAHGLKRYLLIGHEDHLGRRVNPAGEANVQIISIWLNVRVAHEYGDSAIWSNSKAVYLRPSGPVIVMSQLPSWFSSAAFLSAAAAVSRLTVMLPAVSVPVIKNRMGRSVGGAAIDIISKLIAT